MKKLTGLSARAEAKWARKLAALLNLYLKRDKGVDERGFVELAVWIYSPSKNYVSAVRLIASEVYQESMKSLSHTCGGVSD